MAAGGWEGVRLMVQWTEESKPSSGAQRGGNGGENGGVGSLLGGRQVEARGEEKVEVGHG